MEAFYRNVYGGQMAAPAVYLQRAEEKLRQLERSYTVTEAVPDGRKLALCAMAEAVEYFETAQNGRGGLRYASVGAVSVSGKGIYSAVDISPAARERELYRCACLYLDIYRGAQQ